MSRNGSRQRRTDRSVRSTVLVVVLAVLAALPPAALLVASLTGRDEGQATTSPAPTTPPAADPASLSPASPSPAVASPARSSPARSSAAARTSASTPTPAGAPGPTVPGEAATAAAVGTWLREAVDPSVRLVVPAPLVDALARAGHPAESLQAYDPAALPPEPERWDADLVVVTPDLRAALPAEGTGRALRNLPVIARFGAGDESVQVRQVIDREDPAVREAVERDRSQRLRESAALLADPALLLREEARSQLATGAVDARLLALLARLTPQFRLTVADIPARPEEVSTRPRRSVEIVAVDGIAVSAASARTRQLLDAVATAPEQPEARVVEGAAPGTGGDVLAVHFPLVPAAR